MGRCRIHGAFEARVRNHCSLENTPTMPMGFRSVADCILTFLQGFDRGSVISSETRTPVSWQARLSSRGDYGNLPVASATGTVHIAFAPEGHWNDNPILNPTPLRPPGRLPSFKIRWLTPPANFRGPFGTIGATMIPVIWWLPPSPVSLQPSTLRRAGCSDLSAPTQVSLPTIVESRSARGPIWPPASRSWRWFRNPVGW